MTRCVAIYFRLYWRHSDDLFVCFGAKPTQRTEDQILRETGSVGGKEGPREDRESRSTTESRREQLAVELVVQGKDGQQKEAVREDSQRWVSIPSGFVEVSRKIHARDSLQMHKRLHKSVTQTSLSCTWSWPKSVFVCLFFYSHLLCCTLRICKEMCDTSGRKWEKKPLDKSLAMSSLV